MSSDFHKFSTAALALSLLCVLAMLIAGCLRTQHSALGTQDSPRPAILRVAADPNDLPFSNDRREGFENKLAKLVADDLGMKLEYVWRASRRGFVRETVKAGEADLVIGVPTVLDMTLNTKPYYRSTYAFVTRAADNHPISAFDDPQLHALKIGIPLIGDNNPPPAYALAQHGLVDNVTGFTVYADYAQPNPTAQILRALSSKEIDVAIVWAPLAGYFADKLNEPFTVSLVKPDASLAPAFSYNISMGVKRGNTALKTRLDQVIEHHHPEIDALLDSYHIPRVPITAPPKKDTPSAAATAPDPSCDCK